MLHFYNSNLVLLSIAVAIVSSFSALNLSARLTVADSGARGWWTLAAALALGGGIWSTHFVGMLAMRMPANYDLTLTLGSGLIAVVACGASIQIICRFGTSLKFLAGSGMLLGLAMAGMHYSGMAGLQVRGMDISYDPALVIRSIVIAISAATAALWLTFHAKRLAYRIVGSGIMGMAIAGMHYTGMAAATFHRNDHLHQSLARLPVAPGMIAALIVAGMSLLSILGLITAFFDRQLAMLTKREAIALRASEKRYRALTEGSSDIIAMIDVEGALLYDSPSAEHVLGFSASELAGCRIPDFVPSDQAVRLREFLRSRTATSDPSEVFDLTLRNKSGLIRAFEMKARNLLGDADLEGIAINVRDVTERTQMMSELRALAETDLLTATLNRRGFLDLAHGAFETARANGQGLTVAMGDIDFFKAVNDNFGHSGGDLVLAAMAACCRQQVRKNDLLGRMGGEEFAFVLFGGSRESGHKLMQRLRIAVSTLRIPTGNGDARITASFGVTYVNAAETGLSDALAQADRALYKAKNSGRDRVCVSALA